MAHGSNLPRYLLGLLPTLLAIFFVAAAPAPAASEANPASSHNELAVRDTVLRFSADWNRHDMVAFGQLFAPDADFVNVSGTWMKGRNDIQMKHSYMHATIPQGLLWPSHERYYGIFKNSNMRFVDTTVRFLTPQISLAHVDWQLTGDPRIALRKGVFTFVLKKENGRWLIESAQNTEINRTVH